MFENVFFEKVTFSELNNFMSFMVITQLCKKYLTPARYYLQNF